MILLRCFRSRVDQLRTKVSEDQCETNRPVVPVNQDMLLQHVDLEAPSKALFARIGCDRSGLLCEGFSASTVAAVTNI